MCRYPMHITVICVDIHAYHRDMSWESYKLFWQGYQTAIFNLIRAWLSKFLPGFCGAESAL